MSMSSTIIEIQFHIQQFLLLVKSVQIGFELAVNAQYVVPTLSQQALLFYTQLLEPHLDSEDLLFEEVLVALRRCGRSHRIWHRLEELLHGELIPQQTLEIVHDSVGAESQSLALERDALADGVSLVLEETVLPEAFGGCTAHGARGLALHPR
jgi:hypothetical protein